MKFNVKSLILSTLMILSLVLPYAVPVIADYDNVREGDFTENPREGSIVVGITGTFMTVSEKEKTELLARINEIRKEACDEGLPYPGNTSKKLTSSDYVPIKWSRSLEEVAAVRAVEASVYLDHKRLAKNNTSIWTNNYGAPANAENIAWNFGTAKFDTLLRGIDQWYSEKSAWENGENGMTGHYASMINPEHKYIGLSGFYNPNGRFPSTILNQMSRQSGLDESTAGIGGDVIQKIEVDPAFLTEISIAGADNLAVGSREQFIVNCTVTATTFDNYTSCGKGRVFTGLTWRSDNTAVADVDQNGNVTAVSDGTATITASLDTGLSAAFTVTVGCAGPNGHNWGEWTVTTPIPKALRQGSAKTIKLISRHERYQNSFMCIS